MARSSGCVNIYCPGVGAINLVLQDLSSGVKVYCPGIGYFKSSGPAGLAGMFRG